MANLKLIDIKKSYGKTEVIHGLELEVLDGEFCVLVGPSGCGKSTLLRMIAGLEAITEGSIFINDERVNDVSAAKRGLAMVFQSYALYPHMTVRQNLAFGLENLKLDKEDIEYTYSKAGELLGLTRQTIGTYVKNDSHGFRNTGKKKVTKMEVYNYYVEYLCKK